MCCASWSQGQRVVHEQRWLILFTITQEGWEVLFYSWSSSVPNDLSLVAGSLLSCMRYFLLSPMNYKSGSTTVNPLTSALRRLAASILFEIQGFEDTDNQVVITKLNLQETVMSLLAHVELHPRILESHINLCQTSSDENLFLIF